MFGMLPIVLHQVFMKKIDFYYVLETGITPSARCLSVTHLIKLIPSATNIQQTLVTFTHVLGLWNCLVV